jgi:hypothetical protein
MPTRPASPTTASTVWPRRPTPSRFGAAMIESALEFQSTDLRSIVTRFFTLPEILRPTHYSLGEGEASQPIVDLQEYLSSLTEAGLGPFLTGKFAKYAIGYFDGFVGSERVKSKSITCNCYIEAEPSVAKAFMMHMAAAQPAFGFACAPEEREHRNRVTVQQGAKTIESWVGRDFRRYVPGFYWLTLMNEALADKHDVPLSVVEKVAIEHIELEGGQHLFRFYERPEEWRSAAGVEKLCSSLPGVFDVEKIKSKLTAATNFLELNEILRGWK